MPVCCIPNCPYRTDRGTEDEKEEAKKLAYYYFPKDDIELLDKWLTKCNKRESGYIIEHGKVYFDI